MVQGKGADIDWALPVGLALSKGLTSTVAFNLDNSLTK